MLRSQTLLLALVGAFAGCSTDGEYDNPRTFRVLAVDSAASATYEDGAASLSCIEWETTCSYETDSSCVCRRYELSTSRFRISFGAEARSGSTLSTAAGTLSVVAEGAVATGEVTLTKREQVSSGWTSGYYMDFAGTFTVKTPARTFSRGVFYSQEPK